MGGSVALVQLTELKHQRMKQCAEFQQRSRWQPPYALTTALELQAIEIPRLPKGRAMLNGITVVVPSANERRNLVGINEVTWSFPVDVVMVEQCLCVSPVCTWAMFDGWLNLEELIVLAESMMRRDGRLRRTTIEELTAYLDSAREFAEAVFEETGRRPNMFRGYANCRRALCVIQEVTGIPVPVTARKTIQQVCDARAMRRKPLYERIGFEPLLPRVPNANADFPDADDLDGIA
ncbi:MAG: hypothetical protein EGS39_03745 [Bifidobacterium bifidum]|nr:hypothetical protein [Bifidobacterium bifidum]